MGDDSMFKTIISVLLILGIAAINHCACNVDQRTAERVLRAQGFKDVVVGDHAYMSCGKDDVFASEFKALNSEDQRVSGVICCGAFKACTVRF